ncbi:MAG: 50S ribosomal protein L4 [bacterium]
MKISVYNQKGEETGSALLPKEIFDVALAQDLVHQVAVSQMANRRQVIASTKTRGEVRGGGKKPWAQKGTGRSRHGSIRSPLWRHGGITFGPTKERIFKEKIPRKMRIKALFMVLSAKAKNNFLVVLDELKIDQAKTKVMAEIIENLKSKAENFKSGTVLIALAEADKGVILSARNLPGIKTIQAKDLNALDLLSFKYLIMTKDGIKTIKENFLK